MADPNDRLQDCPLRAPACDPDACRDAFDRVVVSHLVAGPTRVMWELLPTFTDPGPLTFRLQVGTTGNPDADDWEDVGLPVVDQYFALDADQRVWGNLNYTHYRVVLTTAFGLYTSPPVGGMGVLDRRTWRLARDRVRQTKRAMRVGTAGQPGYLLKRRWTGEDCPVCLDHQTREVRDPQCRTCYGTGKRCGYYYPVSCVWAALSPKTRHVQLDGLQTRGTVDDVVVKAEMVATDLLAEQDVWASALTDDRYYVHSVQNTEEFRGVPVTANVELRPAPFTDIIYAIEIPQQLIANGAA